MLALTLWPEWPWTIDLPNPDGTDYHPLAKRLENREWEIPLNQWIALHAGKYIGGRKGRVASDEGCESVSLMGQRAGFEARCMTDYKDGGAVILRPFVGAWGAATALSTSGGMIMRPIVTSAIIGIFKVTRYLRPGETDESDGLRGWKVPDQIGNVFEYKRLNKPVPCDGKQGLWQVPADILAKCHEVGTERSDSGTR